jgi:hypothetical protein
MFPRTNNRKAISVVMTTMIILVASVVLGTGVVIYGTSLFQTGGQQQSIASQGIKMWINSTAQTSGQYAAWGAAAIRNNGDVLASVNTIQLRGVSIPFSNWYVDANQSRTAQGSNFQSQFNLTRTDQNFNPIGSLANGGILTAGTVGGSCPAQATVNARGTTPFTEFIIDQDGAGQNLPLCLKQASGPTALNPGGQMIVYFKIPQGVIGPVDSGSTATLSIFAGNVGGPTTVTVGNP